MDLFWQGRGAGFVWSPILKHPSLCGWVCTKGRLVSISSMKVSPIGEDRKLDGWSSGKKKALDVLHLRSQAGEVVINHVSQSSLVCKLSYSLNLTLRVFLFLGNSFSSHIKDQLLPAGPQDTLYLTGPILIADNCNIAYYIIMQKYFTYILCST